MDRQPNIVLLMTDQHRADFTAGSGFALDTMPCLDAVAAGGVRFPRAYTTAPACVPARTSLLTGRYPSAHRVRQNWTGEHVARGDDLLDVLRGAGYSLHFSGKPHMYRGRDDFDTWCGPFMHTSAPPGSCEDEAFGRWLVDLDHGPSAEATPFPVERQYASRIVDGAISALESRDTDRPFFSWLSFPEPHNPYQTPEPYFSMFDPDDLPDRGAGPEGARGKGDAWRWLQDVVEAKRPGHDEEWRRYRATYCGMLRMVDDQVRRFLDHLDGAGVLEDTVVVFVSDHGDYVGDYGLQRKGAGMPEVLMRVPFVVRGPGVRARVEEDAHVSLADLLPTVCDLVGQPIPLGVQGRSLWPLLTGAEASDADFASAYAERGFGGLPYAVSDRPPLHFAYEGTTYDELNTVTQSGSSAMVRRGRWKLVYDVTGTGELHDLESDPMELVDLWEDPACAQVRAEMVESLLWWRLRVSDDLPQGRYTTRQAPHGWVRAATGAGATTEGGAAEEGPKVSPARGR